MKLANTLTFVLLAFVSLQAQTGKLYFSDSQQNQINSVGTDGSNLTAVVKGDQPTDISYFQTFNLVFWSDEKKGDIQCVFANGNSPQVVVPNLISPNGVAIDETTKNATLWRPAKAESSELN